MNLWYTDAGTVGAGRNAMSVIRNIFILGLVVFLLPFLVFGAQARPDNSGLGTRLRNIQLYQVQRGTISSAVSALGTIEAHQASALSFLTSGRVAEVYVERDDYVIAGDPLVRLENDLQRIAYEQASLNLERAELDLQGLQTVDENAVRIAEANLNSAWGAYRSIQSAVSSEDLRAADLAYEQALAAVETARIERDRIGGQFGGDSIEWRAADARMGEATFNAEIARLRAESLRSQTQPQLGAAYARVQQAQRELERVQAGPTVFQVESSALAVERAQNQLDRARIAYERTTLYAPHDGVVASLNVELGALVGPGLVVAELVNLEPLGLTVLVDEVDVGLIAEGMPVRVRLDALPDVDFAATLSRIAASGTNVGGIVSYAVQIALSELDPRIRVGMTAEASIITSQIENVLVVPNSYIRLERGTGRAFVLVLRSDNSLEEVEVVLGMQSQDLSEVVSGLNSGDLIVVDATSGGLSTFLGG